MGKCEYSQRKFRGLQISLLFPLLVFLVCTFFSPRHSFAQPTSGYTLDDEWGDLWRRIADRNGRADPYGPIQQRFSPDLYPEHETDQVVAAFPLASELSWRNTRNGARFWLHSYDALALGNKIQLKLASEVSESWEIRMEFLRHYTRNIRSDLFQVDWRWQPNKSKGPFAVFRFYPRVEKTDIDVGASVGYHDDSIGTIELRTFALDTFANASYWLVSQRDDNPQFALKQRDLPLALSLQASSVRLSGFRAEAYAGLILPQSQRIFYGDGLISSSVHEESGWLGGALIEWEAESTPLQIGASGLALWNDWSSTDKELPNTDAKIDELTIQSRVWALWQPTGDLRLEAQAKFTTRPQDTVFADASLDDGKRKDNEIIASARGYYKFAEKIGAELSYFHREREATGPPVRRVSGTENRIVTRLVFYWDKVWVSFGVGWDPFPRRSVYAGGGGTFIVTF